MKKRKYFQKLYKYEKETEHYLIEVSLDDYGDVYDNWDPSPFKQRDIEDEFHDFIFNSSEDIPLSYQLSIVLNLPLGKKDIKKEQAVISAYRNYYAYALARLEKNMSKLNRKIVVSLLLAVLFLTVGYFWGSKVKGILFNVLREGIFIGGWVFLWNFFTDIFITKREQQEGFKLYHRLYQAELRFVYQSPTQ